MILAIIVISGMLALAGWYREYKRDGGYHNSIWRACSVKARRSYRLSAVDPIARARATDCTFGVVCLGVGSALSYGATCTHTEWLQALCFIPGALMFMVGVAGIIKGITQSSEEIAHEIVHRREYKVKRSDVLQMENAARARRILKGEE